MKALRNAKWALRYAWETACQVEPSFWGRVSITCDALWCKMFLGCKQYEYRFYEFYKYKNIYRKHFIFSRHKNTRYFAMNPPVFSKHKKQANQLLGRGIRREMLYLPEAGEQAFLAFVQKHQKVVVKPDVGSRGEGVALFTYTDDEAALTYFHDLQGETICEECIRQHEALSALNPDSVNTIRVVTLCDEGQVTVLGTFLRVGTEKGSIIDNSGMVCLVDTATGVVMGSGLDAQDRRYIYHPVTEAKIVGFEIPMWRQVMELVEQTHRDVPQCPYLGWDVAVTPDGPEIIEVNDRPDVLVTQGLDQVPKGRYLTDYMRKHKIKRR